MTAEFGKYPTLYPEVNTLVDKIYKNAQQVFGNSLLGFYLDGSLSYDAFDEASDIDFVCVSQEPVSVAQFDKLYRAHEKITKIPSPLAIQIEGFYVSAGQLRRYSDQEPMVPNLERGLAEKLKWVSLQKVWDIHRQYLRQGGIKVFGPSPADLIDPISSDRLREAMSTWQTWLPLLIADPSQIRSRGYQSYIVLTLARILFTQKTGALASKPQAIAWLKHNGSGEWDKLLDDAWIGRKDPESPISPGMIDQTLKLARQVLVQRNK